LTLGGGRRAWTGYAVPVTRRLAAAGGGALLVWLIARAGPAALLAQVRTLGPILPAVLLLTGVRYVLQAAAWRRAMPDATRVGWRDALAATTAAEAVGYLSVAGAVAREGVRPLVARDAAPAQVLIAASVVERAVYAMTAGALSVLALVVVARSPELAGSVAVGVVAIGLGLAWWRRRRRMRDLTLGRRRPAALWRVSGTTVAVIAALCAGQVLLSLAEAYLVLNRLGAGPTWSMVVIFEGATKVANLATSFVPAGLGVAEAAAAATGAWVGVGAGFGIGLALARRVRSVCWSLVGLAVLARVPSRPRPGAGIAPVPQGDEAPRASCAA
ncbi:MAG: lysylphosphatidylglycerol synthase domain-containing protein, partial [Vicinamibacterales bacterium]